MNRSPHPGHWLGVALEGVKSNRDGIGALVRVTSKSGTQYNHQTSSVCYASSSLGPVHFGLGKDVIADEIEIRWPSGIVQKLKHMKADQIIHVKEAVPQTAAGKK
jgi:hypothetical protein